VLKLWEATEKCVEIMGDCIEKCVEIMGGY
jgi:hypothetical protein